GRSPGGGGTPWGNASRPGGRGRRVPWGIPASEEKAQLSVHTQGAPIPPEVLPGLFEPFQRGLHADALDGSIGLGLYIVRQVTVGHGGQVQVQSTAEEGTTFTLELPADGSAPGA